MDKVSLLWPDHRAGYSRRVFDLGDTAMADLRVNELVAGARVDAAREILAVLKSMPVDEETVRYRQEIFNDFAHSPALADGFRAMMPTFSYLDTLLREKPEEELTLWRVLNRMRELDGYMQAVRSLHRLLTETGAASEGLRALRDMVGRIAEDEMFRALAEDLPARMPELNEIRSVTLGLNVNEWLEPSEVTLLSVNRTSFTSTPLLQKALDLLRTRQADGLDLSELSHGLSRVHQISFQSANPMFRFSRDIDVMLKAVLRDMIGLLRRHARVSTKFLLDLQPEISFSLAGLNLFRPLVARGFRFCVPAVSAGEKRCASLEGLFSASLALRMAGSDRDAAAMVLNDLRFDERARIYVLTGPNRGGKTTLTQAIGQAQVLFQAGLPVPAREATLSPVDGVFTHFPTAESGVLDQGRLGEEAARLREILLAATPRSLVLLNESISSTSYTEALYISRDVLKALRYLGCRGIFNTHAHDLAGFAAEVNEGVTGTSVVESLVAGMKDGERSYEVRVGPPLGSSYAHEIAVRNGLSFEQIVEARGGPSG